ncbi:MAG TPA: glycoside hydrolase family 43 protein [Phycisphaerae bacterium]|nr:glycoside hydrolase family 43 protein [Phycisphaerae bacterium]
MKNTCIAGLMASFLFASACRGDNPIVQTVYTADPAPVVLNDTLYVFTGHDEGGRFFTMHDWRCFSTTDMVNWTDHGTPLSTKDFAWAKDDAWAGQVIQRNGKYYYYVPMTPQRGDKMIGVAVADAPEGPYRDALGKPLIGQGGGNIDPTVWIDDDKEAYLYWGNPALKYVKLNEDMISYDQKVGIVTVPLTVESFGKRNNDPKRATLYEEGPWLYKRESLYYMVYAASGIPENICYATSPSVLGPWTFKGIVMPTEDTKVSKHRNSSFTNHPGVIAYKGHNYFFYHNGALPGGGGYNRSVCVEEFSYNADGTFPVIPMTDKGPQAIARLDPFQRQEAATICWEKGVKTAARPDKKGGVYVTVMADGATIKVANVDFGSKGATRFLAGVAAGSDGNSIELHLDKDAGELLGTLKVTATGTGDKFETQSTPVTGAKGVHDVYFRFTGSGTPVLSFDDWKFE